MEINTNYLNQRLVETGKLYTKKDNLTEKELKKRGLLFLKRKLLGFCGEETELSIEELSEKLHKSGIARSSIEAIELIPVFYKGENGREDSLKYGGYWSYGLAKSLVFKLIKTEEGAEACKITIDDFSEPGDSPFF